MPTGQEFNYARTSRGDYFAEIYAFAVSSPEFLHTKLPSAQIAWLKRVVFHTQEHFDRVAREAAIAGPILNEFLIRGSRLFTLKQLQDLLQELVARPRPLSTPAGSVQTKLTVNQPGDVYEQEADRVAEQVMRMPVSSVPVQRKCACGGTVGSDEECAECAAKRLVLQRRSANQSELSTVAPVVHDVLHSPGRPLDDTTRAFMEPRFGQDFSSVRVHTDEQATESARAMNALAYTVGQDVVFGVGQYAPGIGKGQRLLAHELTHVVQQSGSSTSIVQQKTDRRIARTPDLDLPRLDSELFWGDPLSQTSGVIGHSATCGSPSIEIMAYVYPNNTASPTSTSASGSGGIPSSGPSSTLPQAPDSTGSPSQASPASPIPSPRTVIGQPNRSGWRLRNSGLLVPARRALVVGGVHGDERGPLQLVDRLQAELAASTNPLARDFDTIVIPRMNPGGVRKETRENPCGVELNRNFPGLRGFSSLPAGQSVPAEQPEVTAVRQVIEILNPDRILALHAIDEPPKPSKAGVFADLVEDRVARDLACRMALRMQGVQLPKGGMSGNVNVLGNQLANSVCNVRYPETASVSVTTQQSSLGAWASATTSVGGRGIPVITHEVGGKTPLSASGSGRSVDTIMPGIREFLLDNKHLPSEADGMLRRAVSNAFLTGQGKPGVDSNLLASIKSIVNNRFSDLNVHYSTVWLPQQQSNLRKRLPQHLTKASDFRSFGRQASITAGALGQQALFNTTSTDEEIQRAILNVMQTISVPGFSRHHWGTEIDVVSATRSDWEGNGMFIPLIPFLTNEAPKFGFFHPYSDQRPSSVLPHYQNEPWHLSYWPIANVIQQEWITRITGNVLDNLITETAKAIHGPIDVVRIERILRGIGLANFQSNIAPSP
jgi:predicted deacylase